MPLLPVAGWPARIGMALLAGAAASPVQATGGAIQASARAVRPSPSRASADRSRAYYDGCIVPKPATRSPGCVYGDAQSATTVVLFGDSHAGHYFPAVQRVAQQRRWRLVVLTKSGCPPAFVPGYWQQRHRPYHECTVWRRAALRRIARREKPALVVTSLSNRTPVMAGRALLAGAPRRRALVRGYPEVVRRLTGGGAHVVAIRDIPRPPWDIPSCVARSMRNLRRCAFPEGPARPAPDPTVTGLGGLPASPSSTQPRSCVSTASVPP